MSALAVRGVEKRYGGVTALAGCSFEIAGPGIYGLIGPNGAGKTTLFDVIAGLTPPDGGSVHLGGTEVTGFPPHRLAARGVARSFQECRIFPEFTCLGNLLFSGRKHGAGRDEAMRLLELVNLTRYADEPASALSFGQRRLLEIVGTFMQRPQLLLLDEPAAGVNPTLLDTLSAFILAMFRERPCVFLVIEHNMEFVMQLAGEVIVMHQGAVLERGSPAAIQADARVIEAYLG